MDPEQTAPRSSLIWVHTVCHRGFLNNSADEKSRRLLLRLAHLGLINQLQIQMASFILQQKADFTLQRTADFVLQQKADFFLQQTENFVLS